MINEGARILEEGHAQRAADIDVIYCTGYGFPAYRGGPMWYADTVGLKNVYDASRIPPQFGERGSRLRCSSSWRKKAARSRTWDAAKA